MKLLGSGIDEGFWILAEDHLPILVMKCYSFHNLNEFLIIVLGREVFITILFRTRFCWFFLLKIELFPAPEEPNL